MAKKPEKKPTVPANQDREEAEEVLREIMRHSEDDQARAIAAIGLAQLSPTHIH
jgi:predicted negative regulator of RcsB-dependent stress response